MRRLALLSLATSFMLLPACDGDGGPTDGGNGGGNTTPAAIAPTSGNNQRVAIGRAALGPLTVRVTNSQNAGLQNVQVNWAVTAGGGSVSNATTTTNSSGEASVVLTAGSSAGANTVSATVQGTSLAPATFTIQGVTPSAAAKASGDNQMARTSQPLAQPFVLRVTASDNGPVPNLPVDWQVTVGGGALSATGTTTDADGRASSILTLGSTPAANSASATAGGLATQTFNATATTPVGVTVNMQNFAFVAPGGGDAVTIMLGDTVTWVNLDGAPHTAASTSTPTGGTSFDSGTMNQNDTFSYVPNARGAWIYFCAFHPLQMGDARITVQ